jgi:hypothetical protein
VHGVVAQLVERLVRNEKVRGSTPLNSTSSILGISFPHPMQWLAPGFLLLLNRNR